MLQYARMPRIAAIFLSVSCSTAAVDSQAADNQDLWANAGVRFGVSFMKVLASDAPPAFSVNSGLPDVQNAALKKTLDDYNLNRNKLEGTAIGLKGTIQFAVDGTAVTLAGTGVGLVPAIIAKAAGQLAADYASAKMDAKISQSVDALLSVKKEEILSIAGNDLASLRTKTPDELKDALQQGSTAFRSMEAALPNDEKIRKTAEGLFITGLQNVTYEGLGRLQANETNVEKLATNFAALGTQLSANQDQTQATLEKHEESIKDLSSTVGDLVVISKSIDEKEKSLARDQTTVVNILLTQMSPSDRIAALESGEFNSHFECPSGTAKCDASDIKSEIIEKSQKELRGQEITKNVLQTANNISDLVTTARNLGFSSPELNAIASYATVATQAFTAYASGNPLGAAAALSGLFAKPRPDPTMVYMQQAFAQVNQRLDEIIENQKMLAQALKELAAQVAAFQQETDERLGRIEFETQRLSTLAVAQAWSVWAPCYAVYAYVMRNEDKFHYAHFGDFTSFDDLTAVLQAMPGTPADCVSIAESKTATIGAPQWFGNFLDVASVKDVPGTEKTLVGLSDAAKTDLQNYEDIYVKARVLIWKMASSRKWTGAYTLFLLANPVNSVYEFRSRIASTPTSSPCGTGGFLTPSLSQLVCESGDGAEGSDRNVDRMLERPLLAEGALAVGSWMIAASRFADIRKAEKNEFFTRSELLSTLTIEQMVGGGRQIIFNMRSATDAAIASESIMYGEVIANAVVDALEANYIGSASNKQTPEMEKLATAACSLLASNDYLAANALIVYLHNRMLPKYRSIGKNSPSDIVDHRYRSALTAAQKSVDDTYTQYGQSAANMFSSCPACRPFALTDVFGMYGVFLPSRRVADSVVEPFSIFGCHGRRPIPIPAPEQVTAGAFTYPPALRQLLELRSRLTERLLDYDYFKPLSAQEKRQITIPILRTVDHSDFH